MQRGAGESHGPSLNLWGKICFSLLGKVKIINIVEDYRNRKKKKEDFNNVSEGILKLIISNIYF